MKFPHSSPDRSWTFKELNLVVGSYELLNNKLTLDITIQLESKYRNILLLSIPTSIAISYYLGIGHELTLLLTGMMGFAIWRVNEDANFFRELLIGELEKEGL
ncbi:MAG: hypothetical protein RIC03_18955 [Cyclobacteriaceae bacterium]